jgi:anti-anti-sigma regulatory factor
MSAFAAESIAAPDITNDALSVPAVASAFERPGYEIDSLGRLKITADLNIATAVELRDVLIEQLERGSDIVLDLSETPGCDAAAFQIFFALGKSASARNRVCRIEGVSEVVEKRAETLGIRLEELTGGSDREL